MLGVIGYYLFDPGRWLLDRASRSVLALACLFEFVTGRIGGWLYRRRVTLLVLLEIPLMVFVVGPYAYVLGVSPAATRRHLLHASPADFGADVYRCDRLMSPTAKRWRAGTSRRQPLTRRNHHRGARGSGGNRTRHYGMWNNSPAAGYGVLVYDQRALGESSGNTRSWGWLDARDVPYLVDYLVAQPEIDPDGSAGSGCRWAGTSCMLAGQNEPRLAAFFVDGSGAMRIEDFPIPQDFSEQFALFMNSLTLQSHAVPPGRRATTTHARANRRDCAAPTADGGFDAGYL